ncbi:MAG: oligoendopeptidase F, partial [Treponema sp.]|nr:oligoendopeptidase F [Treponema sp.]
LKPHILSEREERLLSLQGESASTAGKTFSLLTNSDMDFGTITVDGKALPLTQSTWSSFMEHPDRAIRKKAYDQFYGVFEQHTQTLASLYAGSVAQDVFVTRARGYASCLEKALYHDKVPRAVYHNLIDSVHKNLPTLHRYYALRKKALGLSELRHYDVYVPLVPSVETHTSYDEAVELCRAALSPLGTEYTDTLCTGLLDGWVDRYENKGKRSGAFSSGGYTGYPYIMLNYKEDVLRDVFTMAHEGGHSMHSWYAVRNNPYLHYSYTIFEAEIASTFNEALLFDYLLKNASGTDKKAYLLAMRAGDILATLHRQTMFAEYELKAHELVEQGTPLSADTLRKLYRGLLEQYFGPDMVFEATSDLEGLRIPHFYGAFYVYKYATGIAAALALSKRVTQGGAAEREAYFAFLKSGGARYPIESVRIAGVDMERPEPIQDALDTFADIVSQLEAVLKVTPVSADT